MLKLRVSRVFHQIIFFSENGFCQKTESQSLINSNYIIFVDKIKFKSWFSKYGFCQKTGYHFFRIFVNER